jgi:hypothetical protein
VRSALVPREDEASVIDAQLTQAPRVTRGRSTEGDTRRITGYEPRCNGEEDLVHQTGREHLPVEYRTTLEQARVTLYPLYDIRDLA